MKEQSQGFLSRFRPLLLVLTFCTSLASGAFAFWWMVRNAFSAVGRGTLEVLTLGQYNNPASPKQAAFADNMVVLGLVGAGVFGLLFFYTLLRGGSGQKDSE